MLRRYIKIAYTNYRGEFSHRKIIPYRFEYKSTKYHSDEQWIVVAFDDGKNEVREFALKDMKFLKDEDS